MKWACSFERVPQVFGNVDIEIVGVDIVIEHVWAANVVDMMELADDVENPREGVRVRLELDSTPQDDQQFDIDGTGARDT